MAKLKPPVNDGDHAIGNPKASVTLVEFGDFQCPHCGKAHPLISRLLREMGENLRFVYRHFPLQEIHQYAHMAALAAEAAGNQGKFWEMHDLIFENQNRLNGHFLVDLAKQLDLDLERFAQDWKSQETIDKVENDFESGIRSGVNGTPGLFINGNKMMTYDETYESFVEAIELESELNK